MAGELRIKVRWKARKGAAVIEETFDYTDDGLAQFCNQVEARKDNYRIEDVYMVGATGGA